MQGGRGIVLLAGITALLLAVPGGAGAATINVTRTGDELDLTSDGKCSLREAISATNQNIAVGGCAAGEAGSDTIVLKDKAYSLSIPTTNEDGNLNGDLDLSAGNQVIVKGEGIGKTAVNTAVDDRLFDQRSPAGSLTVRKVGLVGGDVTGQGTGSGRGGVIRDNVGGTLTIDRSLIRQGTAYTGGGVYYEGAGTVTISRSRFDLNLATGLGGGLDAADGAVVTIDDSVFYKNSVIDQDDASQGGGISNRGASMKITDTAITENHADGTPTEAGYAGGISSQSNSKLTVLRSLIAQNTASSPTNNVFEAAAGVFVDPATKTAKIANTTFFDNDVGSPDGRGGAIYQQTGTVKLYHDTFAGNDAGDQGNDIYIVAGTPTMRSSILSGLIGDFCAGAGDVVSEGYNVAQNTDADCGYGVKDLAGPAVEPGLKFPLAFNGGLTETLALKKSSDAVNLVPKKQCKPARKVDQRGYGRPAGKRCDAGAFERRAKPQLSKP